MQKRLPNGSLRTDLEFLMSTRGMYNPARRTFLRIGMYGIGSIIVNALPGIHTLAHALSFLRGNGHGDPGPLLEPDDQGVRLVQGLTARLIARSGEELFGYKWHAAPDGGATFPTDDGGWIYVSNSEMKDNQGGAGAICFDNKGTVIDAYSILTGTNSNCAGGPTPWLTWLSCEEVPDGLVWECDPFGKLDPVVRPQLGRFMHEAVTIDTIHHHVYLTEDRDDGCLYRYIPHDYESNRLNLDKGKMEVAQVLPDQRLAWHLLPDFSAKHEETRYQVKQATKFNGGEGIWFHNGIVYFTTKGDDTVWAYNTLRDQLEIIYRGSLWINSQLSGVDNITVSETGEVLVAEDGGNMEIVVITENKKVFPLLQLIDQDNSEITGPAFSPDGTRLYFSSQRGFTGQSEDGLTYEITGVD